MNGPLRYVIVTKIILKSCRIYGNMTENICGNESRRFFQ